MRSIAEITAGKSVEEIVDSFLGSEPAPEAETPEVEHVASAADLEADVSQTAPGFPEHLEKLADMCDGFADQLSELPKTAALTGDIRVEFADMKPPVAEQDSDIESMLDRVLGEGGES